MKYMLLVHHDEEAFVKLSETKRQQMLEESVELTHQLHAKRQYIKRIAIAAGGDRGHRSGARRQTIRHRRSVHRDARAASRLFPDRCQGP